jgi:hypothetical protein
MLRDVRAGLLDVVVVFALARLSRKGALDVLTTISDTAPVGVETEVEARRAVVIGGKTWHP